MERQRSKETKETVEMRYSCKYKIVWRDRERKTEGDREKPKEINETIDTVETTGDTYMQIQNCMERQRETEGD